MYNIIQPVSIFLIGEVISLIVFWMIVRLFKKKLTISSVFRGILERGFLLVCLLNELPHGLAFFGALKIATRLKEDDDNKISNDYFLTGNLISVLIVIAYYLINKNFQFF